MRYFQISEDDLAELERTLPRLADTLMLVMTNETRTQIRRVKEVISNVRWNYGPPTDVQVIPADEP